MTETQNVISECVDGIPSFLAQLEHMWVQPLMGKHFPTHGNWLGLSLEWDSVLWWTYVLWGVNGRYQCLKEPVPTRSYD